MDNMATAYAITKDCTKRKEIKLSNVSACDFS